MKLRTTKKTVETVDGSEAPQKRARSKKANPIAAFAVDAQPEEPRLARPPTPADAANAPEAAAVHVREAQAASADRLTDDVAHESVSARHLATISDDHRRHLIAEVAYYRALRRGFVGGSPESDWLEAEAEVTAQLAKTDQ